MKVLVILVFSVCAVMCAQTSPEASTPAGNQAVPQLPNLPDSEVIAELPDHSTFTMGDVRRYFAIVPQENQANVLRNLASWVEQWSRMRMLAHMAETDKLDQRSPTKEQLEYERLLVLAQAEVQDKTWNQTVEGEDVAKRYDATRENYKEVKVSAIYISFGEKGMTQEQAKVKAEKLLAQIRKGADFAKLARENSDDITSKEKDGAFGTLSQTDNIPDALRAAVFQLKKGQVSEPIAQPNGFYLLRADDISYKPLSAVRDTIFTELRTEKVKAWMDQIAVEAKPKFTNPKFPAK